MWLIRKYYETIFHTSEIRFLIETDGARLEKQQIERIVNIF